MNMNRMNRLNTENNEVLENQATLQRFSEDRARARREMKDYVQDQMRATGI